MGSWGFYDWPTEPDEPTYWEREEMAERASLGEFIEREMSYADSKGSSV